jgi:hypothetical protein
MKISKKALSEMVSYTLLVVIAVGLSVLVYAWLRSYINTGEKIECGDEIALSIIDYTCSGDIISLSLKNNGFFNINGFFMKASNISDQSKVIATSLNCVSSVHCQISGRYDFVPEPLKNKETITKVEFNYNLSKPLERISLQPYIKSEKKNTIAICPNIIEMQLENCD